MDYLCVRPKGNIQTVIFVELKTDAGSFDFEPGNGYVVKVGVGGAEFTLP